jgi:hypothetical protein
MTKKYKIPVQSLIDHIKTAIDVDPWAKEMAEELLKEQEPVEPIKKEMVEITARYEFDCSCGAPLLIGQPYCADCGKSVKWDA